MTSLFFLTAGTRGWSCHSFQLCSLRVWWCSFARLEMAVITDKVMINGDSDRRLNGWYQTDQGTETQIVSGPVRLSEREGQIERQLRQGLCGLY